MPRPGWQAAASHGVNKASDLVLTPSQAAKDKNMNAALNTALSAVLTAINREEGASTVPVNALTLVRCLIDMSLAELRKADEG